MYINFKLTARVRTSYILSLVGSPTKQRWGCRCNSDREAKRVRQNQNLRSRQMILFLKNESMENPEVFTVNPNFLNEVGKNNECNLFDFSFELNEDGTMKTCSYKWEVIDPNIWAWIFLVRHEYIKQKRKAESNYKKKIQAVEKREEYKETLNRQTKKQIEHRKQIHDKDRTVVLYRRILEKLVLNPDDMK